jgi:pyruvate dehydrogenase E2 component (dihydrolipoamide acetyltransferase)
MVTEVILPKLGQTMEEGTIVEWIKKEGDAIKRGEILFTVETDKATLEVEATTKGILRKIIVPAGRTASVLTIVALVTATTDEDISSYLAESSGEKPIEEPEVRLPVAAKPVRPPARSAQPASGRILASPRARRVARDKGVDLAEVAGTGPGGRITESDVLAHLEAQPKATPAAVKSAEALGVDIAGVPGTGAGGRITKADVEAAARPQATLLKKAPAAEVPLTGLRRIIAERMATSHQTTARVTLTTEVDATSLVEMRDRLKASVTQEWGFTPAYNDLLGMIVTRALGEFPYVNARLSEDGQSIQQLPYVNLGIAVDTERGLLVPVVRNAHEKGLRAFGTEFRALLERAQAGKSVPDDLTGGTFTVTNLGAYGIDAFTPIINLPETAILGVGRIQPKPAVQDGEIVVRQLCTLSLTFDHRLVDGAPAARFLQRISELVQNPYLLLE